MKKLIKNIKKHKVMSIVGCTLLVLVVAGGVMFGIQMKKTSNTQKALELAASGEISEEQLQALEDDGGFADFGTEIVDPSTGETVVLTQADNGTIVRTVTRDASGQATGAVVPQSSGGSGHSSGGYTPSPAPAPSPSPTPAPAGHSHSWVAHYATRQVPHTETIDHPAVTHKESYDCCSECNQKLIGCGFHVHNGINCSTYVWTETIIDKPAWTETVTTYTTEQYIDYYYCSDCGERK